MGDEKSGKLRIDLSKPIEFGSEKIEHLEFRPATARDFRDMPLDPKVGDLLNIAAKLSGHPPAVIDGLSPADLVEVLTVVGEFVGGGQETGKKP